MILFKNFVTAFLCCTHVKTYTHTSKRLMKSYYENFMCDICMRKILIATKCKKLSSTSSAPTQTICGD